MPKRRQAVDVTSEVGCASLGDARLDRRLALISKRLSSSPSSSFPDMAASDAELEGMYRFLSNERVSWRDILRPHVAASISRCEGQTAVVAHDTTEFHFRGEDGARVGLGYLSNSQRGFEGHFALAVSGDEGSAPLGVVGLMPIVTSTHRPKVSASAASRRSTMTPQAEKKTARWDALVREVDAAFGGNAIHVADREGDAFVHWAAWREDNIRFVVRAKADRHLEHARMSEVIAVAPIRLEREVALSSRKGSNRKSDVTKQNRARRTGRMATLEVRATTMTIPRPPLSQALQDACTLNVVHVIEVAAAPDETPVEWTLLTSEPVTTTEEVARVVDLYRKRWVIEEFFKALKTGCAYEDRQLMSLRALLNGLVVAVPVAWRMLALRSLAHRAPEQPASSLFAEDEIRLLRIVSKRVRLPEKPSVDEILRAIAGLGGHLKRNGPPGWQTLGRGFDRFLDQYTGWVAAGRCDQS